MASKRLSIYVNDHFAAAIAAGELARRSANSNRDTPLGDELDRLANEIEEDRSALETLMHHLGVTIDHKKAVAAWTAEKLGRLKLNGGWVSYSALSRLEELEFLTLGVEGKLLLWEALAEHPELAARLDLAELARRARAQRRRLKEHRIVAVRAAL
jgi:hypothetical protein